MKKPYDTEAHSSLWLWPVAPRTPPGHRETDFEVLGHTGWSLLHPHAVETFSVSELGHAVGLCPDPLTWSFVQTSTGLSTSQGDWHHQPYLAISWGMSN